MRISLIKKELNERGVGYVGLLEKSEFVDLLVDARARGITAPSGGGDGGSTGGDGGREDDQSGASAGSVKDGAGNGFDPSYKEVEVR